MRRSRLVTTVHNRDGNRLIHDNGNRNVALDESEQAGRVTAAPEHVRRDPPSSAGTDTDDAAPAWAYPLLLIAPALFASNMVMARFAHDLAPPYALAFWRWAVTFLLLLPFVGPALWRERQALKSEWRDLLVFGALGMGICGAFVYVGADTTTATNIGLIYASSPIFIVLIARLFYDEAIGLRQALGIAVCLAGVLVIIARGDLSVLTGLHFHEGDLWILSASISWAIYSIMLKHRRTGLSLMPRFLAIIGAGVIVLAPFTVYEHVVAGERMIVDWTSVAIVVFLALVPSIGAYQAYARLVAALGPGRTGVLLYLGPLYGAGLAWLILGEQLQVFHLIGAALILPGLYLATVVRRRRTVKGGKSRA